MTEARENTFISFMRKAIQRVQKNASGPVAECPPKDSGIFCDLTNFISLRSGLIDEIKQADQAAELEEQLDLARAAGNVDVVSHTDHDPRLR